MESSPQVDAPTTDEKTIAKSAWALKFVRDMADSSLDARNVAAPRFVNTTKLNTCATSANISSLRGTPRSSEIRPNLLIKKECPLVNTGITDTRAVSAGKAAIVLMIGGRPIARFVTPIVSVITAAGRPNVSNVRDV